MWKNPKDTLPELTIIDGEFYRSVTVLVKDHNNKPFTACLEQHKPEQEAKPANPYFVQFDRNEYISDLEEIKEWTEIPD